MSDQTQPEGTDEASEILKELRAENKRLKKEAADLPSQIRSQVKREYEVEDAFKKVGYPKLATAFLKDNAEAELTEEAVTAFLDEWGLEPRETSPATETVNDLAKVTTFADRINAQATGQPTDLQAQLDEVADKAKSVTDLANGMANILAKQGVGVPGARTRY